MHVYVYNGSHCDKDKMKPSKKFEAVESSGGNYPNRDSPRWEMDISHLEGQLSQQEVVRVQLSGANFPRWELSGM